MRLFRCACSNLLYFENRFCLQCGRRVGYDPAGNSLRALTESRDGWSSTGCAIQYKFCSNARFDACNWLLPHSSTELYCGACRHNGVIPDLSDSVKLEKWRLIELAKHRLFYSLIRWRLPLQTRRENPQHGLIFHFPSDPPHGPKVMTGHEDGVITIALTEADDAERETRRVQMGEPYRTLLGHFRHEVGHHYWDLLVRDQNQLSDFRTIFGDETQDYSRALQRHYETGAPPDWQESFVSAYAASHPWEDFAETWAHYVHIVDTLETASAFGMQVRPELDDTGQMAARIEFDPYISADVASIIESWIPIVFALNNLSRSIGKPDLYPFVLSARVIEKLGFIHRLVRGCRQIHSRPEVPRVKELLAQPNSGIE
jgi:hypothetical protein